LTAFDTTAASFGTIGPLFVKAHTILSPLFISFPWSWAFLLRFLRNPKNVLPDTTPEEARSPFFARIPPCIPFDHHPFLLFAALVTSFQCKP